MHAHTPVLLLQIDCYAITKPAGGGAATYSTCSGGTPPPTGTAFSLLTGRAASDTDGTNTLMPWRCGLLHRLPAYQALLRPCSAVNTCNDVTVDDRALQLITRIIVTCVQRRYTSLAAQLPAGWQAEGFDASSWGLNRTRFGYGGLPPGTTSWNTPLPASSTGLLHHYFR